MSDDHVSSLASITGQDFPSRLTRVEERQAHIAQTLNELDGKVDHLISLANQWAGVRKAAAALATVILLVGALSGYVIHYLWGR